jgi:transposase InsO family protein
MWRVVDVRLSAVLQVLSGDLTTAQAGACLGVSRQTMQRYVSRYRVEGVSGLLDRSRRPQTSPRLLPAWVEDEVLLVRKEHPRWGARKIRWLLAAEPQRLGEFALPAASTVHRVLVRHGEALGARVSTAGSGPPPRRFRASVSNRLWQLDAWAYALEAAPMVWVLDIIDDYSRFLLASRAMAALTTEQAWALLVDTVAAVGMPARLLSDNGLAFTGRAMDNSVLFERQAQAAGIRLSHARAVHPQTCGKIERNHGTVEEWLLDEPPARTIDQLQAALDRHRDLYNHIRPHQALDGARPGEVYHRGDPVLLPIAELAPADPYPPEAIRRRTKTSGQFRYRNDRFDLGPRFGGIEIGLIHRGARLHVYYGAAEIATYALGYQPDQQPR